MPCHSPELDELDNGNPPDELDELDEPSILRRSWELGLSTASYYFLTPSERVFYLRARGATIRNVERERRQC